MTQKHTEEIDIFYKEHRKNCTKCGKPFSNGDTVHLGYLKERQYAVLCDCCSPLLEETVARYYWQKLEYDEPLPDDFLWRYMDLSKYISLISRKELYFAAANTFEDIFEGAKGLAIVKDQWDSYYHGFFEQAIKTAPGLENSKLTEEYIDSNADRLLEEMAKNGEKRREYTYINCWHHNFYESEAMWKLYSKDITNAIAIKTTVKHLYESLGKNPSIDIGKVKYVDLNKRFTSVNAAFWYKRKSFEYENEVRAITVKPGLKKKGIYVSVDLDKLIDDIYISPYAPEWFVDVVKSVSDKYNIKSNISYSQMKAEPFY